MILQEEAVRKPKTLKINVFLVTGIEIFIFDLVSEIYVMNISGYQHGQ